MRCVRGSDVYVAAVGVDRGAAIAHRARLRKLTAACLCASVLFLRADGLRGTQVRWLPISRRAVRAHHVLLPGGA